MIGTASLSMTEAVKFDYQNSIRESILGRRFCNGAGEQYACVYIDIES